MSGAVPRDSRRRCQGSSGHRQRRRGPHSGLGRPHWAAVLWGDRAWSRCRHPCGNLRPGKPTAPRGPTRWAPAPYQVISEGFVDGVASVRIGQIDMQNVVSNRAGDTDSVGGQGVSGCYPVVANPSARSMASESCWGPSGAVVGQRQTTWPSGRTSTHPVVSTSDRLAQSP